VLKVASAKSSRVSKSHLRPVAYSEAQVSFQTKLHRILSSVDQLKVQLDNQVLALVHPSSVALAVTQPQAAANSTWVKAPLVAS
jgi:hypothetical protein